MTEMTKGETVNAIVNGVVAFGTLVLAALVVYGDRLRAYLTGPKLRLVLRSSEGLPLAQGRLYYHLVVENKRPTVTATGCRVQLRTLWRRDPAGNFVEVRLPYPLLMCWPPSEYSLAAISVLRDEPVDFGSLVQNEGFWPGFRAWPQAMSDQFKVGPRQTMRYGFDITSDQSVSLKLYVVEVYWNGQWTENPAEMQKNLQITEVQM